MDPRIEGSIKQFPDAEIVYEKDGYWELKCSKCGRPHWWPTANVEDDVMVLQWERCISEDVAKMFPEKNIPICDGKSTYILVKESV